MTEHRCHAHGCERSVPPSRFACEQHWFTLRKPLRDAIWREYRSGQERDKRPSPRYCAVQRLAVAELAFKPNDEQAARTVAFYLQHALRWRQQAIEEGLGDPLAGLLPAGS